MKIVILDAHTINPGDLSWDELLDLGEVTIYDRTLPELLIERAVDAEIILPNKAALPAAVLDSLPKLRFVQELATGFDNIDIRRAGERGIPVANVPEYSTESVAQHTMALILSLSNRISEHDAAVKAGEWSSCPDFCLLKSPLIELAGKRLGIIGLGRIGRRVAELATAFGMEVSAYNRRSFDSGYLKVRWDSVENIFAEADVVSLHCPLSDENRGFVDRNLIGKMKKSAFLVNTARGALIKENDLADALNVGVIAGAALDVVSSEPIPAHSPLLSARNCILTPHIAWATAAARGRLISVAAANIRAFLDGKPQNIVNREFLAPAK